MKQPTYSAWDCSYFWGAGFAVMIAHDGAGWVRASAVGCAMMLLMRGLFALREWFDRIGDRLKAR